MLSRRRQQPENIVRKGPTDGATPAAQLARTAIYFRLDVEARPFIRRHSGLAPVMLAANEPLARIVSSRRYGAVGVPKEGAEVRFWRGNVSGVEASKGVSRDGQVVTGLGAVGARRLRPAC